MSDRLDRMRRNPRADWKIGDVEAVCREYDVECRPSKSGSSHYKVKHQRVPEVLTVPFKRPIKPIYICKLVEFIEKVIS
jgi:hypothetical protein